MCSFCVSSEGSQSKHFDPTGRCLALTQSTFIHVCVCACLAVILILVSQRADDDFVRLFGTANMKAHLEEQSQRQRGQAPSKLELLVVLYVIGFMWEEVQEIFAVGMRSYLRNMWNFIDFLRNTLYVCVMCLR